MKYFLLLISLNAFAYRPTVESLFRNNNNEKFESPTTSVGFLVRKQNEKESYYTLIAISETPGGSEVYQIYKDKKDSYQINISKEIPRMENILGKSTEQALFYSIMGMLLRNKSQLMISTLKNKGFDISFNKEMENKDKKRLLERYRSFLEKQRLDPTITEENSPLNGKTDEEKKSLMGLFNEDYYQNTEKAQMVKDGNNIYWKIMKDGFEALFHSATRRLYKILYAKDDSIFEISFSRYFKADGIHEIPQFINVRINDEIYTLEVKDYAEINLNNFQKIKAANRNSISKSSNMTLPAFFLQ